MSVSEVFAGLRTREDPPFRAAVTRVLFGDRIGLLLFFASVCLFGLLWRTSIFITDTYALANGLYNLANGRLFLTEAAYGPELNTPGVWQAADGQIARNYGAIVLSVPIWALLEGLSLVADLRVSLVGLYSLSLLAFGVTLGRLRESGTVILGSSLVALAFFIVNIALATPLDSTQTHLYALQIFHLLVAAFAPVLLYRLLARVHTTTVGVTGASILLFGTPLAIWAPVPKRHVITATVGLVIAYALYRSREHASATQGYSPTGTVPQSALFRALAYAAVGLYAWINAPEALTLLVVLAVVDLPTAPDNRPRTLAVIGAAFALSVLPFVLTNYLLTGSPITPPRLLGRTGTTAGEAIQGTGGGSGGIGGGVGLYGLLPPLLQSVLSPFRLLGGELVAGASVLFTRPEALYATLIRSGDAAAALDISGRESANLAVLESAPILAALVGWLSVGWRKRHTISIPGRVISGQAVVDLFVTLLAVTLTLLYAHRLPVHAQLTVRYLFPLYPLGVYLLLRLPVVRHTISDHWRAFAWTTAATVLIGGQLVVVAVFWTAAGLGEAIQFHAVVGLVTALPLAIWALVGRSDGVFGYAGSVSLGVTTALASLFGVLTAIEYYPIGNAHLLPIVRIVAESVTLL